MDSHKQAIIKRLDELGFLDECVNRHLTTENMSRLGIALWAGSWAAKGLQQSEDVNELLMPLVREQKNVSVHGAMSGRSSGQELSSKYTVATNRLVIDTRNAPCQLRETVSGTGRETENRLVCTEKPEGNVSPLPDSKTTKDDNKPMNEQEARHVKIMAESEPDISSKIDQSLLKQRQTREVKDTEQEEAGNHLESSKEENDFNNFSKTGISSRYRDSLHASATKNDSLFSTMPSKPSVVNPTALQENCEQSIVNLTETNTVDSNEAGSGVNLKPTTSLALNNEMTHKTLKVSEEEKTNGTGKSPPTLTYDGENRAIHSIGNESKETKEQTQQIALVDDGVRVEEEVVNEKVHTVKLGITPVPGSPSDSGLVKCDSKGLAETNDATGADKVWGPDSGTTGVVQREDNKRCSRLTTGSLLDEDSEGTEYDMESSEEDYDTPVITNKLTIKNFNLSAEASPGNVKAVLAPVPNKPTNIANTTGTDAEHLPDPINQRLEAKKAEMVKIIHKSMMEKLGGKWVCLICREFKRYDQTAVDRHIQDDHIRKTPEHSEAHANDDNNDQEDDEFP